MLQLLFKKAQIGTVFHNPGHSLGIVSICWDIKEDAHLR